MAENPQGGKSRCNQCGKEFNSPNELREHEKNCRGRQQP